MSPPDRFLLAGVMGWPVMHSRSPMLHNYWFRQYDLAGSYVPLHQARGSAAALRAFIPWASRLNLTIRTEAALTIVDEVDAVRSIGAISCVSEGPMRRLPAPTTTVGLIQNRRQEQPESGRTGDRSS